MPDKHYLKDINPAVKFSGKGMLIILVLMLNNCYLCLKLNSKANNTGQFCDLSGKNLDHLCGIYLFIKNKLESWWVKNVSINNNVAESCIRGRKYSDGLRGMKVIR